MLSNYHFMNHLNDKVCVCALLAFQKVLTLLKADSIRVTFLGGSGAVTLCHGHHSGSTSHQKLTEMTVVAGGRAMQRRPVGQRFSTSSTPPLIKDPRSSRHGIGGKNVNIYQP